jgi:hypothetical protein
MTEWNPNDPDASKVFYDLSEWTFDQQAELSAELAEAEIPHTWEGSELVVPEDSEADTDALFSVLEARLGIVGVAPTGDDGQPAAVELDAETASTEYDLADWAELEHDLVSDSLTGAGIPFRWEGAVLLVPTVNEEQVDDILDDVESGNIIPIIDDGPDGDIVPFESLNSFFLAGERLRRDPLDATGLQRLLDALEIANPDRPPSGVELGVWRKACGLAEDLADGLVEEGADPDDIRPIAESLHDLLRPLI